MTDIQKRLFSLADEKYKKFNSSLIPNVEEKFFIGVRTPDLRALAKELIKNGQADEFINELPHEYYEENNLHGFIINEEKNFDRAMELTEKFLPFVDNWGTCDSLIPKAFKREPERTLPYIKKWLKSDKIYTVRFAVGLLMRFFQDDLYERKYSDAVTGVKCGEYYIDMMVAWYFATLLAKQYESAITYLEEKRLSPFVHNKTISKACESFRIDEEKKRYIKSLK